MDKNLNVHNLKGVHFTDAKDKQYKYIYPNQDHWAQNWIFYKDAEGNWIAWRKATQKDLDLIAKAISDAHHCDK